MNAKELQDHLYTLEERLLHPEREQDRSALIPLLADDFKEFCSSGRIFNRDQTIEALLTSTPRTHTIGFFYVTQLAPNVALATYHSTTTLAATNRSSLWVFRDKRWQLLFHQGTPAHKPPL
jgi:hypothetical protein